MTLVILAAGMGSRYGGLKQIDPITENGEFIIDFSIYDAIKAGFDKVVFIIKEENLELFRESVGARVEPYVKVEYAFQELSKLPEGFSVPEGRVKPWGTSHALLCAREFIDDNFAVINADDFYGRDAFVKLAAHLKTIKETDTNYCMIGYILRNTLTENGTVSRGKCETTGDGMLDSITELTKIKTNGADALYLAESGEWEHLPGNAVVSMNCWGLGAETIGMLDADFDVFMANLHNAADPAKAESLLPTSIDTFVKAGKVDVKVYPTESEWYGVTYQEDKPWVVSAIQALIDAGEYPEHLWG